MKKGYKETMLQMILSPIHIFVSDNYQVPDQAESCVHKKFNQCFHSLLLYSDFTH